MKAHGHGFRVVDPITELEGVGAMIAWLDHPGADDATLRAALTSGELVGRKIGGSRGIWIATVTAVNEWAESHLDMRVALVTSTNTEGIGA